MKNKRLFYFWHFFCFSFTVLLWRQVYAPLGNDLTRTTKGMKTLPIFLLLGSDQREDEPARADTIMVVSLQPHQ